jgi:hypothetical protein
MSPQSPRGEGPPHIRLNSGTQTPHTDDNSPSAVRPSTLRTNSARSLTQPTRPSTAPQAPNGRSPLGPSLYTNVGVAESAEMLLPPRKLKTRPYRDESPLRSPSAMSSRRTSWSSDMSRGPFASPFDDSRAPSRAGSEEDLNTQTVSEKFNILPSAGLLLFPEDVEKDDYLHNPDPNEKEKRDCNIFTRRGMVNVGGLGLLALGILVLFIGYPILYVPLSDRLPYLHHSDLHIAHLSTKLQNKKLDRARITRYVYRASRASHFYRTYGEDLSTPIRRTVIRHGHHTMERSRSWFSQTSLTRMAVHSTTVTIPSSKR